MLCAALLFAALFVFALARLFELRFEQGDIYPPYSTLRTDPLGASVFYESLETVPGVTAQRYFEETFKSDDGREHALFMLGADTSSVNWLSRSEFDTLQRFVFNGGRVVIAYYPEVREPWWEHHARTNETDQSSSDEKARPRHHRQPAENNADESAGETNRLSRSPQLVDTNTVAKTNGVAAARHKSPRHARRHGQSENGDEPPKDDDDEDFKAEMRHYTLLPAEWGFEFRYESLDTNDDGQIQFPNARRVGAAQDLPSFLPIHTALCFTNLTNGWTTVYERGRKIPVVVERKLGAGSVVLVADSYPFSNEALFKNRSAPLLAWFLGSGRNAIFDEAHLGIAEQPGMATLMRRYQLHGLILSLLLAAGLFVWKNSRGLIPPHPDAGDAAEPVVAGRDSASGLVNLARRGIAPVEIINVCFAEWRKSNTRLVALSPAQRRDLEQLIQQQAALSPHQRKPVENYRVIAQILQRRH